MICATRVPRLACQAVRYFGQHGLTSNPWHPATRLEALVETVLERRTK